MLSFLPSSVPEKMLLVEYVQARRLYHVHEETIKTRDEFRAFVIDDCFRYSCNTHTTFIMRLTLFVILDHESKVTKRTAGRAASGNSTPLDASA